MYIETRTHHHTLQRARLLDARHSEWMILAVSSHYAGVLQR